jgi:pyruvate/2-oxoglutarate dehydrogenase complex dihydrolipoamide dehydrogenase (E3) component
VKRNSVRAQYDLAVIGAGSAGLAAAPTDTGKSTRVLLVEKHKTGGECLRIGCVPGKSFIHAAKLRWDMENASIDGLPPSKVPEDLANP